MSILVNNAINAYQNAAQGLGGSGAGAKDTAGGESFTSFLNDAIENTVDIQKKSEQVTAQAAAGKADMNDIITAVNNAEVSLQEFVAIRDKVISAYQEIEKMPI